LSNSQLVLHITPDGRQAAVLDHSHSVRSATQSKPTSLFSTAIIVHPPAINTDACSISTFPVICTTLDCPVQHLL